MGCSPINNCKTTDGGCTVNQTCSYTGPASNTCPCKPLYYHPTENTTQCVMNRCLDNLGGCGNNSLCTAIGDAASCSCNQGFVSASGNGSSCVLPVSSSSSSIAVIAGAGGGGGAALLIAIVVIVLFVRYKRQIQQLKPFDFSQMVESNTSGMVIGGERLLPREIKRGNVKIVATLGKGNFGEVSKGLLAETAGMPGYLVAVKVLHKTAEELANREALLAEASIMAQFSHRNVVRLLGVVTMGEPMLVVIEYCEHGSLDSYLQATQLEPVTLLKIAYNCASGLAYLSSLKFIHRDIASRNVLIDSELTAKISDFGMSRETTQKDYYRSHGGPLPVRWTAPEALEDHKFSEQSDVWSFGILLHEIWTQAESPYTGMSNEKVWVKVLAGYRLPCPPGCPEEVHEVMMKCWVEAGARPAFAELEIIMGNMLAQTKRGDSLSIARTSSFQVAPEEIAKSRKKSSLVYLEPTDDNAPDDAPIVRSPKTSLVYSQPDVSADTANDILPPKKFSLTYLEPSEDNAGVSESRIPIRSPKNSLVYMQPDTEIALTSANENDDVEIAEIDPQLTLKAANKHTLAENSYILPLGHRTSTLRMDSQFVNPIATGQNSTLRKYSEKPQAWMSSQFPANTTRYYTRQRLVSWKPHTG